MKYIKLILFVTVAIFTQQTIASASHTVSGPGSMTCGQWIEAREQNDMAIDHVLSSWIQGFLSGMNVQNYIQTEQKMAPLPDAPTILAYVDKECGDAPLNNTVFIISVQLFQAIKV